MIKVTNRYWVWAGPIALFSLILDQLTKAMILGNDAFNARGCLFSAVPNCGKIEISQSFDLSMVWNYGMSFGMMQSDGIVMCYRRCNRKYD